LVYTRRMLRCKRLRFLTFSKIIFSATGAYVPICRIKFQLVLKKDKVFLDKKINVVSFGIVGYFRVL
jgi:hypothetical protein